jgi:hypothetical protein
MTFELIGKLFRKMVDRVNDIQQQLNTNNLLMSKYERHLAYLHERINVLEEKAVFVDAGIEVEFDDADPLEDLMCNSFEPSPTTWQYENELKTHKDDSETEVATPRVVHRVAAYKHSQVGVNEEEK